MPFLCWPFRSLSPTPVVGRSILPGAGRQHGFTLLELIVSIAIFTIVGALAMGGYNQLVKQSGIAQEKMQRVRKVQAAVLKMSQDLEQLEPRPVRQPLGSATLPALLADNRNQVLMEFTRAGWSNSAGVQRSTLQRVDYRLQDKKLYRDYYTVLDRTLANEPVSAEILDKVHAVTLRFMDQTRTWQSQWPPLSGTGAQPGPAAARARPFAVEITVELEDWGKIVRVVELPG
jgi:general secretion pathway protein J